MNRKKRIIIYSVAISLFVLGFLCIFIAAFIDDKVNYIYVNIIGFSSFGFMIASFILLVKNYSSLVVSEMSEKSEKMHNETDFFSTISINESPQTLEDRFIKSGFKMQQGYLHKKQFSFAKDYVNYYVVIVEEENIKEYLNAFIEKMDD